MNRSSNNPNNISFGKLIRKGSCLIISFGIFVLCSVIFNGWKNDPSSPKNYIPTNEYKKEVIQGEKDRIEFEEIKKRIEARKEREQKEFVDRSNSKPGTTNTVKGQSKDPQEEKIIKVKQYVKQPVYSDQNNVSQPQDQSNQLAQPVQPVQQPKKLKPMVRYNDWVDEPDGVEIKDTLENASQDKVIKEKELINIDREDQQR